MSKTLIDVDEVALRMAMAHYGTTVKRDAVNRALREVAERRALETSYLEDWITQVGERLGAADADAAWHR